MSASTTLIRLSAREAAIVREYKAGLSLREVGERFGLTHETIRTVLKKARATIRPRGRRGPSRSPAMLVEVPAWVDRAGLRDLYLRVASRGGEERAASYCRKLKGEAV